MNVLIAASECAPFVKVGGLGDVIGSLPKALKKIGVNVSVAIPAYKPVIEKFGRSFERVGAYTVKYSQKDWTAVLFKINLPGTDIPLYLIKNDTHLSNGGIYFDPSAFVSLQEEIERFAFFSKAVSDIFIKRGIEGSAVDLVHCNDWHTGMIPKLISPTPSVFTIHNLANQGFSSVDVAERLGIDITQDRVLSWDAQDDNLDFILQGIIHANYINTVSPTYAKEIQTQRYGEGLHEVLKAREGRLLGILNGIDYSIWNPKTDAAIYKNYDKDSIDVKKYNKRELQKELDLDVDEKTPVIALISRLVHQKGIDILNTSMSDILGLGAQLIILGTGDPSLENKLRMNAVELRKKKKNISVTLKFDSDLARKIYAGSDMFLIPSRFEPCGLVQMISMKYGTIPIVRRTGGLADTVTAGVTGFVFDNFSSHDFLNAVKRAVNYYENVNSWKNLVIAAMEKDFGWEKSAEKYVALYKLALSG